MLKVAEAGERGPGAILARVAGSRLAQAVTGLPGIIAGMLTNPGDRPAGKTPETTAQRQRDFEREYQELIRRRGR